MPKQDSNTIKFCLKFAGAVILLAALWSTAVVAVAQPALTDKLISYSTNKNSLQYIVIDLAKQAGLGYNWDKSYAQTDPDCRRFVTNVSIVNQPFDKAMGEILDPVKLGYRVEHGEVVLFRR